MTTPSQPRPSPAGRLAAALLLAAALAACDTPAHTIKELRTNLDTFQKAPNMATLERLDQSFDKIDAQIRELESKGDAVQADLFRRQAMTMRYEYRSTRMAFLKWAEEQAALKTNSPTPPPSP